MLEMVQVVQVNPESHSVDVVVMQDGRRFSGVPVMTGAAGGDFGSTGFGVPTETGFDAKKTGKRDVFAILSWVRGQPVIMGFLHPKLTSMLFADRERSVSRHPSDVYTTIDGDGNIEVAHPSGAFIRIATDPAHEDLSGKDYNGRWSIERNTDKAVHIHVEQAGGVASIDIAPDGSTVVTAPYVKVDAPVSVFTGRVTIAGSLNVGGAIGSGADVVADSGAISLLNHTHPNEPKPNGGGGAMPPADD